MHVPLEPNLQPRWNMGFPKWLAAVTAAVGLAAGIKAASGVPPAAGLLETHTLFTVYGRGFRIAPILGRLGSYADFAALESGTRDLVGEVARDSGKPVASGIDLIYGLAVPCKGRGDCLEYLDGSQNLVERYIVPAQARSMTVVLDTQLGRSDPVAQIQHMIGKGYLDYENVHVAVDPEFHVYPGGSLPGSPIGVVTAGQINDAQALLDALVARKNLRTKKILIVHQFGDATVRDGVPVMIRGKAALRTFPNVELVVDMDGLGTPLMKVHKYNRITSSAAYPLIQFRGIKVFYRSPLEHHGHFDKPPLTIPQVFGLQPVPGGVRMESKPNVVIVA
ncbi:MAG TPA: hypothetical protein VKX49_19290 [Bryobacteraceae bacterium]|nr:hypothetical protein [Bryobacteraceae bacterium]